MLDNRTLTKSQSGGSSLRFCASDEKVMSSNHSSVSVGSRVIAPLVSLCTCKYNGNSIPTIHVCTVNTKV